MQQICQIYTQTQIKSNQNRIANVNEMQTKMTNTKKATKNCNELNVPKRPFVKWQISIFIFIYKA